MKALLFLFTFLLVFGVSFYFFMLNSQQSVELVLWNGFKVPPAPVGLVVLLSFFMGIVVGMLLLLLTYVIKRVSS